MQMTGLEKPIEDDTNAIGTPIVTQPPRLARRGREEIVTYKSQPNCLLMSVIQRIKNSRASLRHGRRRGIYPGCVCEVVNWTSADRVLPRGFCRELVEAGRVNR